MRNKLFTIICLLTAAAFSGLKAQDFGERTIFFHSGEYPAPSNIDEIMASGDFPGYMVEGMYYELIHFAQPATEAQKATLQASGIRFYDYIPNQTWLVAIPYSLNMSKLKAAGVDGMMDFRAEFKLRNSLRQLPLPAWAVPATGYVDIRVLPFPGLSRAGFLSSLKSVSAEIIETPEGVSWVTVRIPQDQLEPLANNSFVQFAEPIDPPEETENYEARGQHRSRALYGDNPVLRKYDGSGIVIGMGDDGEIGPHIDKAGRFSNTPTLGYNGGDHGDHVSGTIMGAGNLNPEHQGMAPGAFLYVYGGAQSLIVASPSMYNNADLVIGSTSMSNGCNAGYTLLAQTVDNNIYDNEGLILVYSAGNEGPEDCGYGAGSGWGNVTGGHKIGKNCITVGAMNSSEFIAGFSSRGPAHDGRLKPEVCGKGVSQWSTGEENSYYNASGTSMSCPGVSGVTAQLYHAYKELHGDTIPNSGLIKAVLMNNCDDVGNPGPDYIFGYGRINALYSVEALEQNRYFRDQLATGESDTFTIQVAPGSGMLKIMTYWHDKESSVSASRALVNDLNMVVKDPNGNDYNPWVLDPTPNPARLNANAVRGIDNLNNSEQVTLDSLIPGTYTIIVSGLAVPQGPQEYFVTYTVQDSGIRLTYPLGGEDIVPYQAEKIYWNAVGNHGTFRLEFSTDNGSSWQVIDSTIPGDQRFAAWVPQMNVSTDEGWMRITRGSEADTTDFPVIFCSQPPNLRIGSSCPNSFTLAWDSVPGATGYEVSRLGTEYMDSIGVTSAIEFTVNGFTQFQQDWFSVRAILPSGVKGRRAVAIEKTPGVFMCQDPDDIGVSQIVVPAEGPMNNCGAGLVNPKVEIENASPDTLTGFSVSYSVNGGTPVTETFSGTLLPYDVATHTFASTVDLSTAGAYQVKAWTTNNGDMNPINDTLEAGVEVFSGNVVSLPYAEDFESFTVCSPANNCGATSCPLGNDMHNATNDVGDDIDWRPDANGTLTNGTGPLTDHNPGTNLGIYAYLEASSCYGKSGQLITPCIDLSQAVSPKLNFWFSLYGADMGELHVDLNAGGEWILDITSVMRGDWGDKWWDKTVDLSPWNGQEVTIRFRGITGTGDLSDMALDDISVVDDFIGIDEALLSGVRVFPNPSAGRVNIRFDDGADSEGIVMLHAVNGKQVYQSAFRAGQQLLELDPQDLPGGVYFLTVSTQTGTYRTKWIKL